MSELDLSKAIGAASKAMWDHDKPANPTHGGFEWPPDEFDCCAEEAVRAALPHFIKALAEYFESEDPKTLGGDDWEFRCVAVYLRELSAKRVR